jgi:hypothetical protein
MPPLLESACAIDRIDPTVELRQVVQRRIDRQFWPEWQFRSRCNRLIQQAFAA